MSTTYVLADDSGALLQDSTGVNISQGGLQSGQYLVDGNGNYLAEKGTAYPTFVHDARDCLFITVEINTKANGVILPIRISDLGYRTRRTDPDGVQVFPALLDQAYEVDRRVSLELTGAGTSTYGAVRIFNLGRKFDNFLVGRNTNARKLRIAVGQKTYDGHRGIYTDPSYSSLRTIFSGLVGSFLLNEQEIEVPVKDTSFLIDRPIQYRFFTGAGYIEGPASFKGSPKPMCRGGTADNPIQNVLPRLVDPVQNVWMFTDGAGQVQKLYENNAAVFTYSGDVADPNDFYSSVTPPGSYRTCNAFGYFQLGSTSVGTISANVTGTVAGTAVSTAAALAYGILKDDLGIPEELIDGNSFAYADKACPYVAGFFLDGQENALTIIARLLASIGGHLLTGRDGRIGCFVPPRTQQGAVPVADLDESNIISIAPVALPSSLDPPPYRWQICYQHNFNVQTSGYNPSATELRKQFIVAEERYAVWTSADVQAEWLRPNDPEPVQTYLLDGADAQKLADSLGDQWKSLPSLYQVSLPLSYAVNLDIGSYIKVTWPLGALAYGMVGQIVGEQQRAGDGLVVFEVLINTGQQGPDTPYNNNSQYFVLGQSLLGTGVLAPAGAA